MEGLKGWERLKESRNRASKRFHSDYSRGNRWRVAHFLGPTSSSSREWIFHLERPSRPSEREKERRGLKEGHIKLWIFHQRKSSASDSASPMELFSRIFYLVLFPLLIPFFRLFYPIASLKVERAKWLAHFAIIGAAKKKKETGTEKKRRNV